MPRRKLSQAHKQAIARGVRAYHDKARKCLKGERATKQKPKLKTSHKKRRIKPTTLSKGQSTTLHLLKVVEERALKTGGADLAPGLAF